MGDQPEGMAKVPEAIAVRAVTVETQSGPVVVEKWSITRFTAITTYVAQSVGSVSDVQIQAMVSSGLPRVAAAHMLTALGNRIPGVIEMCVREADKGKVADMLAEDALEVLSKAVELNFSDTLVKNLKAIWATFRSRLQMAPTEAQSTQSK